MPIPLLDNTTWIVIVGALGAAALAVVLCVAIFVLVTRNRHGANDELERMFEASNARFEEMLGELAREVERAQDETRRSRQLAAIGASIDLDTVLSRALEAAAALPPVDAALVIAPQEGEPPVIATYGMTPEEAAEHPVAAPSTGDARAVEISYRYGPERAEANGGLIRGALALPLSNDAGESVGTMAVFWREEGSKPSEDEVSALEHVATNVGPAIVNARRFREARKLADLDALTSLHNRRYFHDTLAREVARAHRYDRQLALVVFDIDDFKAINERVGHLVRRRRARPAGGAGSARSSAAPTSPAASAATSSRSSSPSPPSRTRSSSTAGSSSRFPRNPQAPRSGCISRPASRS